MNRLEYNTCMKPYITGKDKSKEERQMGFCMGAKICSGKAKTPEEAMKVCNAPRLPKWASGKEKEPAEEKLTCPQKVERTLRTIVEVKDLIKSGKTEEIKKPLVVILQDTLACAPEEIAKLAADTINDIKKISGDFYFKGEGREMVNDLKMLEGLLIENFKFSPAHDAVAANAEAEKAIERCENCLSPLEERLKDKPKPSQVGWG